MGPAIRIHAVVFDLDGLLVDSESLQIAAWHAFLASYGARLDDGLVQEMFGLRLSDSARLVTERLALPLTTAEVIAQRDAIFLDSLSGRLRPMPGARELVAELTRRGIPLALATSGHRRYVERALAEIGLTDSFSVKVTAEDVERGKPAPDCYRLVANRLGLPPATCLALEDAPLGVHAARAAGLRCLAVPNEHTRSLPGLAQADAVLPSLHEVLPWLETLGWSLTARGSP
jgi:HAD superfamily hydrolase (TIGR01509 family)